jgi:signal recognition particle subunit SRP19
MLVWPASIDSSKSRLEGRKIPKSQGIQTPRIDELIEAARRLSIETEAIPQKSRPRTWWEKTGYILIPKGKPRAQVLRSLSAEIRKMRAAKTDEKERKQ